MNSKFNNSDILLLILDNSATAMTGFQPHPGSGVTAMGDVSEKIDISSVCNSLGINTDTVDPYDFSLTTDKILTLLQQKGPRVLILKRNCALVQNKQGGFPYQVMVNQNKCLSDQCGCNRYCTRIFRCPGLIWDATSGKSKIDDVICVGCGICEQICPNKAIEKTARAK